jgi:hypothetical protein
VGFVFNTNAPTNRRGIDTIEAWKLALVLDVFDANSKILQYQLEVIVILAACHTVSQVEPSAGKSHTPNQDSRG